MTQQTDPCSLQLPLTLDCSENGPIEHAQALFAQIQPGDTLYVRETASNDPASVVSEAFVRVLEVTGPSVSQWVGFEFHISVQAKDDSSLSLLQPDPRPFDQVIFRPSAQLSELLLASAYFGKHSDASKNDVTLARLSEAELEETMHAVRERRVASEKAADELLQAQNEAERTAFSQIDIASPPPQLLRRRFR